METREVLQKIIRILARAIIEVELLARLLPAHWRKPTETLVAALRIPYRAYWRGAEQAFPGIMSEVE